MARGTGQLGAGGHARAHGEPPIDIGIREPEPPILTLILIRAVLTVGRHGGGFPVRAGSMPYPRKKGGTGTGARLPADRRAPTRATAGWCRPRQLEKQQRPSVISLNFPVLGRYERPASVDAEDQAAFAQDRHRASHGCVADAELFG